MKKILTITTIASLLLVGCKKDEIISQKQKTIDSLTTVLEEEMSKVYQEKKSNKEHLNKTVTLRDSLENLEKNQKEETEELEEQVENLQDSLTFYKEKYNELQTYLSEPQQEKSNTLVVDKEFVLQAKDVIYNSGETTYQGILFDYWPNGGLYNVFHHLSSLCSYAKLVEMAPMPIYTSGPHTKSNLSLGSTYTFGHYNPQFITWLTTQVKEITSDEMFIEDSKNQYHKYFRRVTMAYYDTYKELRSHPAVRDSLKESYQKSIDEKSLKDEYYRDLIEDPKGGYSHFFGDLVEKHYYNIIPQATGFWLRREIDGTAEDIFQLLNILRVAYKLDEKL